MRFRLPVVADLHGEEMLKFRTGKDLLSYCEECVNGALTPVSQVLGCTKGDDPEVQDYFQELDNQEHDENNPKCPGFTSRSLATPGEGGVIEALMVESHMNNQAGMIKEVPVSLNAHNDDEWQDLIDDALHDVAEENPDAAAVLTRGLAETQKRENYAQQDPEREYDYAVPQERAEKYIKGSVEPGEEAGPETDGQGERDAFYDYLKHAGLTADTSPEQAREIVTQAMLTWRDGLMATQVDDNVVKGIITDFQTGNY